MSDWIIAQEAFAHVVRHEVSPEFAQDKILDAIRERKLPVRARLVNFDGEDGATGILPMSFWEATDVSIDFDGGTARSIIVWTGLGTPATAIENARDLEFSGPHLFALWARPEEQHDQPERDAPLLPPRPARGSAVIAAWTAANALWKGKVPRKPVSELHISINKWLAKQPDMIDGKMDNKVSRESVERAIGRK